MTFRDFFYQEYLLDAFISFVSYVAEAFVIIDIILISICFLGKGAKITKKALVFPVLIVVLGFILNSIAVLINLQNLTEHGNDLIDKTILEEGGSYSWITTVVITLFVFFTAFIVYDKRKILNGIESVVAYYAMEFYFEMLILNTAAFLSSDVEYTYDAFAKIQSMNYYTYIYVSVYGICAVSMFFVLYFGIYKKQRFIYVSWKYRILFVLWELLMLFGPGFVVGISKGDTAVMDLVKMIIGGGVIMMAIVVPFIIFVAASRRQAIEKSRIQESYIEAELQYIDQYKRSQKETSAFRHDIINNLSLLEAMIQEGKTEEAEEHLSELLGTVRGMSPKYVTGDEMLDCIVGMKAGSMDEKGIEFALDGMIDGGLDMKPVDVCTIFANALDNAIEACDKIAEKSRRWIKLNVKKTDRFLSIKLSNSMVEDNSGITADRLFDGAVQKTSKKDKNLHGFGTLNMKKAIEKYAGMLKAEQGENEFVLSIMIPR